MIGLHLFLLDRSQRVSVNGFMSEKVHVKSGVPQGSVLGPLLILILMSDIDCEILESFLSSFADDTRIGMSVTTEEDAQKLQDDLDSVYRWADKNNMTFNITKFEVLRYGSNSELKKKLITWHLMVRQFKVKYILKTWVFL